MGAGQNIAHVSCTIRCHETQKPFSHVFHSIFFFSIKHFLKVCVEKKISRHFSSGFFPPHPTSNGGMQNGSSVEIYVRIPHTFLARVAPTWMLRRCSSTKFLRRSSVGSLLRVRCRLGTFEASQGSRSKTIPPICVSFGSSSGGGRCWVGSAPHISPPLMPTIPCSFPLLLGEKALLAPSA